MFGDLGHIDLRTQQEALDLDRRLLNGVCFSRLLRQIQTALPIDFNRQHARLFTALVDPMHHPRDGIGRIGSIGSEHEMLNARQPRKQVHDHLILLDLWVRAVQPLDVQRVHALDHPKYAGAAVPIQVGHRVDEVGGVDEETYARGKALQGESVRGHCHVVGEGVAAACV